MTLTQLQIKHRGKELDFWKECYRHGYVTLDEWLNKIDKVLDLTGVQINHYREEIEESVKAYDRVVAQRCRL